MHSPPSGIMPFSSCLIAARALLMRNTERLQAVHTEWGSSWQVVALCSSVTRCLLRTSPPALTGRRDARDSPIATQRYSWRHAEETHERTIDCPFMSMTIRRVSYSFPGRR